ncbi:MAG: Allantoicase repeat-domain-containing protein, partial [Olpidium bornovanus]
LFAVPRTSRRVNPFVDHVISFTVADGRVWIRNFQIAKNPPPSTTASCQAPDKEENRAEDDDDVTLVEIGPRLVLNPIRIFAGSFGGGTVYANPSSNSPASVRALARQLSAIHKKSRQFAGTMGKEKTQALKPEEDTQHDTRQAAFDRLTELAADAVGGKVLFATDDFFAVAENMISRAEPACDPARFTDFGKWMDGWETRRKRIAGHDWCILELGLSGTIEGIEVDTAYFTGNNAPRVSVQAACLEPGECYLLQTLSVKATLFHIPPPFAEMGTAATAAEIRAAEAVASDRWETILPISNLGPGRPETRHSLFKVDGKGRRWTHLRHVINMHPDGGIARLRVYGNVVRDWSSVKVEERVDLASPEFRGVGLSFDPAARDAALLHSDAHYGKPAYCLGLGRAVGMFDGWETARNPNRPPEFKTGDDGCLIAPGSQWAVFELGHPGTVEEVEIDTYHFKGNYPESCLVEVKREIRFHSPPPFPTVFVVAKLADVIFVLGFQGVQSADRLSTWGPHREPRRLMVLVYARAQVAAVAARDAHVPA